MDSLRDIAFKDVVELLRNWTFPADLDGVVGIGRGGIVPAALTAQRLGLELKIIQVQFREEGTHDLKFAEPRLVGSVPDLGNWRRILLVDDVYVSGRSWRTARSLLPRRMDVRPFVIKGQVDFALIQDIDGCVHWPWMPAE